MLNFTHSVDKKKYFGFGTYRTISSKHQSRKRKKNSFLVIQKLADIPLKTECHSSTWSGWDMLMTFLQFPLIIYDACSKNYTVLRTITTLFRYKAGYITINSTCLGIFKIYLPVLYKPWPNLPIVWTDTISSFICNNWWILKVARTNSIKHDIYLSVGL